MTSKSNDCRCPVCNSESPSVVSGQPEDYEYFIKPHRSFRIFHCNACGSRFLWPRPNLDELISFYPADYHAYHEDHGQVARWLVERRAEARARQLLALAGREPVRLFDVGTGDCRHFLHMSRYGSFDCVGVEIKPEMVEAGRSLGFTVYQGTLEELEIDSLEGSFDIVTMYQLLEHVESPYNVIRKAFRLLRKGGSVLGQLPSVDSFERVLFGRYWAGYHYPRHLQAFSREGLQAHLERVGFEQVKIESALHLQPALSLQNFLIGRLHYRPKMIFGKTPIYSLLLVGIAPFCILEYLVGKSGMMNFRATRP